MYFRALLLFGIALVNEKSYIKVGVIGSRARNSPKDRETLRHALLHRIKKGDQIYLVSGGCPKGGDRFAEELSKELRLPISIHYPDKSSLPPNHTVVDYARICYARNTLIAEECDLLIALWDHESSGTYDTIKKARNLGKPVVLL